ncbi:CPBP family intramembrane metalloprotease [Duganella sp. CY15W]|uniref:CPBP family intramembrane glutamic endopeptidase n=1 Tax=Duganella sp. CY15W TaxID=2692172 RepID=UPI00136AE3DD|nr:type II CAAX endopeptidase family protein [Duganella sp. CY15W]MYM30173.1 CPBP family intramembrane metalloprotease [Duganella sp. CY15W]
MSIAQQIVSPVPTFRARLFSHPVVRIVLGVVAVMLPMMLTLMLSEIVPKPERVVWPFLLAATMSLAGYRLFTQRLEKREGTELASAGATREAARGVAIGAALGLGVAGVLAAAGAFIVTGSSADWTFLLKSLPEQIMVACFEELLFRAVLFRIVEQRWGTRTALVVSFLAFALAHMQNEHVSVLAILITGVAGLTLSACYLQTRRIWLSIGVHFGWNFLYDGFFSVPVSGHAARGWLQVSLPGPEWLTGGAYGVEGSVVTLVLWSAAAVFLLRRAASR